MQLRFTIVWISRLIVGLLFIFSGFIKAVDPHGFSYKLEEYFAVFGTDFLVPFTLALSIIICVAEILLGIALLLGIYKHTTTMLLLIMIVFFTILTGFSAITGKVTDCGCFGDFIVLTPWQSFIKDVALLVLILILFLYRYSITLLTRRPTANIILVVALVVSVAFSLYNYLYLPVFDFRAYKEGNNIKELMEGESGEYEYIFRYRNTETGESKEFSIDDIPEDPWKFEDNITKEIKAPVPGRIQDFSIFNEKDDNLTDEFLEQPGYKLLIVQYNLDKSNTNAQNDLNLLVVNLLENTGIRVWALTSSSSAKIEAYVDDHDVPYRLYFSDATTLKTIIRSNPGLVLFNGSTVVKKWPSRNLPTEKQVLSYMK